MTTLAEARQQTRDNNKRLATALGRLGAPAQRVFGREGKAILADAIAGLEGLAQEISEERCEWYDALDEIDEDAAETYQESLALENVVEEMLQPLYAALDIINATERACFIVDSEEARLRLVKP